MMYHNTPDGAGQTVFYTDTPKRRHLEDIHEIARQMMQLIENEQPRQIGGIFITDNLLTGACGTRLTATCTFFCTYRNYPSFQSRVRALRRRARLHGERSCRRDWQIFHALSSSSSGQ